MLKHCILILFVIGFHCTGHQLTAQNLDSLEAKARSIQNPKQKLNSILLVAEKYYSSNRNKSNQLFEDALEIATANKFDSISLSILTKLGASYRHINNHKSIAYSHEGLSIIKHQPAEKKSAFDLFEGTFYINLGSVFNYENNYDSAEFYFQKSVELHKNITISNPDELSNYRHLSKAYNYLGGLYTGLSRYEEAINSYMASLEALRIAKDSSTSYGSVLLNIGNVHFFYGDTTKAEEAYNEALAIALANNHPGLTISAYTNLGSIEHQKKHWLKADSLYKLALKIRMQYGPVSRAGGLLENMGLVARELGNIDEAMDYFMQSMKIKRKQNLSRDMSSIYANIGNLYLFKKNYKLAKNYLDSALQHAVISMEIEKQIQIYLSLSQLYEMSGNLDLALNYFKKYKILDDSIHSIKSQESINLIQEKYNAVQKDRLITEYKQRQQLAILAQEKQALNNRLLAGLIVFVVFISIFILFFINNKRKIEKRMYEKDVEMSRQKMLDMVKEQEMISINAFISGQERERNRIASDLHDRLGSLLSTVKLHFSSIEPYFDNDPELSENFGYAISLLDKSVSEVRSVSHNLAKEILTEFGLTKAVQDLCESINTAGIITVVFINNDFDRSLNYEKEIEIYRIIQELVTNAIKHAKASELVIQFTAEESLLTITVEDDGVGFDVSKINKNGMGLANIFQRTAKVNGRYHFDSSIGNGSTFIFEIPLTSEA
ncbi:MAG: tetratricopeptide repeat protein [Bacteroidales bacterium]|nr:tetratricopeptide repeat protein [Bacteroidales bacterium]